MRDAALLLVLAAGTLGCAEEQGLRPTLEIEVLVEAEPGLLLSGVPVYIDQEPVGVTDRQGLVRASAHATPGSRLAVTRDCPEGHRPVEPSRVVRVHHYAKGTAVRSLRVRLRCSPSWRRAVFVVRAKNGPSVRVALDGEHVATTNQDGIAHFSRRGAPGTEYSVQLDATQNPDLLPRRASYMFRLPDADRLFLIDQGFRSRAAPMKARRRRPRIIKIE